MAHADAIAAVNLAAGHQVRQRLYEQALNGALQVPRAIPETVPSISKKSFALLVTWTRNGLFAAAVWIRCCTISSSISTILRSSSAPTDLKTTILSNRLMNSGVNFRRAAATPALEMRAVS